MYIPLHKLYFVRLYIRYMPSLHLLDARDAMRNRNIYRCDVNDGHLQEHLNQKNGYYIQQIYKRASVSTNFALGIKSRVALPWK